jgi:hypothetical protein
MNKFENPQGPEARENNVIDFQAAKTHLKEGQPNKEDPESIRERLRAEVMEMCYSFEKQFRDIENEGLSNVRPEIARQVRIHNEGYYQAVKALRDGALDIISQPMSVEELLEIGKLNSDLIEEINQRYGQDLERVRRGQPKR